MKIAVTSRGKDIDSEMDPRFGRAAYFIVVDPDTMDYEVVDNQENINALKGAGIQASEKLFDHGVDLLITGYCGPNAFKTLHAGGIKVIVNAKGKVREAVEKYVEGELSPTDAPNVEEQW